MSETAIVAVAFFAFGGLCGAGVMFHVFARALHVSYEDAIVVLMKGPERKP